MSATVTISGVVFEVPERYAAGHTLTEGEASALNQTHRENVRNNLAKYVKEFEGDEADLRAEVASKFEGYVFGVRAAGTPRVVDPVQRIAIDLARTRIKNHLAKNGRKVKDVEKESYEAEVARIAALETTLAEARKLHKAQQKALEADTEIGELTLAPAESAAA